MAEAKRVGIALSERAVRGVVVERDGAAVVVERVAEVLPSQALTPEALLNGSQTKELRAELVRQLENKLRSAAEWVIALPTGFCRVRLTPIDGELLDDEVQEQARWELVHALVDDVEQYNFGVERIRADIGLTDRAVIAAVRKDLAAAVRTLFSGMGGRLISMEADVFSAVRAFQSNYESDPVRPSLLLGREPGLFHAAALTKDSLVGYAAWPVGESVGDEPAEIASFVRDVIERYVKAQEICSSLEELSGIYLYGDGVGEELLEVLRDTCEARVERLNPFQRYRPTSEGESEVSAEVHPEAFAAAFGAALW